MKATIKHLTEIEACRTLIALKEKYKNNELTNDEEHLMYDLSEYFWKKAGGKRTLLSNIPSKK